MLGNAIRKSTVATAIAGALCALAPAHAIVVSGTWDPKYGSPFEGSDTSSENDDMFWSGKALFTIPDTPACTPDANQVVSCSGMFASNAEVYLREGEGGALLDTLIFNGSVTLTNVKFDGAGNVLWVQSNFWEPLVSGTSSTFSLANYAFSLGFDEFGAMLFHTDKQAFLDKHGSHGGQEGVFWNGVGKGHLGELCSPTSGAGDGDKCGFSDNYGQVVFAPIPEPSTYALMFAGLGAVGFMARRRRQKPN